jgi:hypothetical protein
MPSTYSPALRLELIGNGEQASNWGNTTNTNLGTLLEQAITGYKEITLTAANTTLLASTGASDDARNAVLMFSGSPGASPNVIVPTSNKFYAIKNNTGVSLTVKTSAGSGPAITPGYTQLMYCNGTDVIPATVQFNSSNGNITTPGTIIASTALYSYGSLTVSGNILCYSNATINGTINCGPIFSTNQIKGASLVSSSGAVYLASDLSAYMSYDGNTIILNKQTYTPISLVGVTSYNYSYTGNSVQLAPNQSSSVFSKSGTASTNQIVFNNDNGQVGFINTIGSSTGYGTSSDYRLKTNVSPMIDALKTVSALKPCTYEWKVSGLSGEGFIAHELQEVVPHAVMGEKDAINEDGSIKPQGIDYSKIVVHLVAAIQELTAKIEELEKRIASN